MQLLFFIKLQTPKNLLLAPNANPDQAINVTSKTLNPLISYLYLTN
jgi:hypothetical protein